MAAAKTPPYDQALERAWDQYCDRLKAAGRLVFRKTAPSTELVHATGYQYLARYTWKALSHAWEFNDPLFPELWQLQTPTNKSFGDNPDCTYLQTRLDGQYTYRIVGNRGTVSWVSFAAMAGAAGHRGVLNNRDLKTQWDGSIEVVLSPKKHAGNWIETKPGPYTLLIRQFFGEWDTEVPMRVRIERVGAEADEPPPLLTADRVVQGLKEAADWLIEDSERWAGWIDHFRDSPNRFVHSFPAWAMGHEAALGRMIHTCYWKVQPDEALLIEVKPPPCFWWNFELNNYWMTSMDYRYRFSSINGKQAVFEDDGSVRIVLSHKDPGIPNWLDAAGHPVGLIIKRWVEPERDADTVPRARLVKFADLPKLLPPHARRVTRDQRREQLRRRKIGVDRRFAV